MTDDFANQAVSFLCGDLDRGSQAEFEELLDRDPDAAAALKACADAMARYALAEAGELPFDPRERAEMAARIVEASGAGRAMRTPRLAWLWPMAAVILLGLNLWQWAFRSGSSRHPLVSASAGAPGQSLAGAGEIPPAGVGGGKPVSPGLPALPGETNTSVAKAMAKLAALRQEYGRLQISKNELNAEYAKILQQLAAQEIMAQGASRVVAMELVDSASYANGGRPGLFDLSTAQLTKPGVVAAGPATSQPSTGGTPSPNSAVTSPVATGAGQPAPVNEPESAIASNTASTGGGVDSVQGSSVVVQDFGNSPTLDSVAPTNTATSTGTASGAPTSPAAPAAPATSPSSAPSEPAAPPSASGSSTPPSSAVSQSPYAVSLFDEAQEQGYMDLYNLPPVTGDQTLQLWVLPVGSDNFQNVGQVPVEYYGGSGSIYYKLPDGTATPSQILITVEPRSSTLAAPTGTVVLRGP